MSDRGGGDDIYRGHPQQSTDPTSHLFSSESSFSKSLTQHEKELHEYYQDPFQCEPKERQDLSSMGSINDTLDFQPAGPSGLSSRIPASMSDIEGICSTASDSSVFSQYGKQFIDTGSLGSAEYHGYNPNLSLSHYAQFSGDYHPMYAESDILGLRETSSLPPLMPEPQLYGQSEEERKQILETTIQGTVETSQPATTAGPVTPIRPTSNPSQPYKPVGRPRRGRRRGYRRGNYARNILNRPSTSSAGERESFEAYENRNIQEEARNAYVQITEQPRPKALRFRYICEGRSAGSIPGIHSTPTRKTFPSIRVVNSKGPALVVVSCVTTNPPYRPHPHNLVGKEGCEDGVCSVLIDNAMMECSFSNLGIQCVKKRDIEASLSKRASKMIDPFQTGFEHRKNLQSIDLNSIRLCFQVYLLDKRTGNRYSLQPVVSEPIYDKKATSDLIIYKLSACSSCVSGGKEIILLCDKIVKEDIQVRFLETIDGVTEWEAFAEFQSSDVHKQVAISFKTPQYKDLEVKEVTKVWLQLYRPSDKTTSDPVPFEYYPINKDYEYVEDKILHINQPTNREALTSDSPADSMQEVSDEGEMTDTQSVASGATGPTPTKRFKSSPSHRKSGSSGKLKEHFLDTGQTMPVAKSTEAIGPSFLEGSVEKGSSFDQSYCPQIEGLESFERKSPPISKEPAPLFQASEKGSSSRASGGSSILLLAPTATLASSSSETLAAEVEKEAKDISYHEMELTNLSTNTVSQYPSHKETTSEGSSEETSQPKTQKELSLLNISTEKEKEEFEIKEESLSPNSETIKRLKHDIETLNKLSNL